MKIRLALILTLALLTLVLGACATAAGAEESSLPAPAQALDESWDAKSIEIAAGSTFTVTLASNPTTGFSWNAVSDNPQVLLVASSFYHATATAQMTPVAGAGGQEVWTFHALAAGTAKLSMDYSRPWAGGEKGVQTFTLTVTVK